MKRWWPLVALATAQFVMVLDQSVMNVSISQLVEDFDTTVTTIQAVITLYCLVMAMLMLTGAKIGDIIGRRRAFVVGLVIYACGSALTAASQTVLMLALGWSVLEGVGAALVLPALAALIAGNFEGESRKAAYAVIGGVAGAGIAVGPILGGWATTELTWRIVFVGEVLLCVFILAMTPRVKDAVREGRPPKLDALGAVLSAVGLGAIVLGTLQASTWGWLLPKNSPVTPLGFSLAPFVMAFGGVLLWCFVQWQHRREAAGADPLVHLALVRIPPLRAGLAGLFSQNLILMGVFFVVPLYLQLVLGLDALQTGVKMLPISVAMLVASAVGSRLSSRFSVRAIVRSGLAVTFVAVLVLLGTVDPTLSHSTFAIAMAGLGVGMGLLVSQLGNVVQSSVDASGRAEAGGLQYTGQQLGSSFGVALIGAIVLTGLASVFVGNVSEDPRLSAEVSQQVGVAVESGLDFLSLDQVSAAAKAAGLDDATTTALVEDYADAQITSLKLGLLVAALLALGSLPFTRNLPHAEAGATRRERSDDPAGRGVGVGTGAGALPHDDAGFLPLRCPQCGVSFAVRSTTRAADPVDEVGHCPACDHRADGIEWLSSEQRDVLALRWMAGATRRVEGLDAGDAEAPAWLHTPDTHHVAPPELGVPAELAGGEVLASPCHPHLELKVASPAAPLHCPRCGTAFAR